jgi:hypothetical protein
VDAERVDAEVAALDHADDHGHDGQHGRAGGQAGQGPVGVVAGGGQGGDQGHAADDELQPLGGVDQRLGRRLGPHGRGQRPGHEGDRRDEQRVAGPDRLQAGRHRHRQAAGQAHDQQVAGADVDRPDPDGVRQHA